MAISPDVWDEEVFGCPGVGGAVFFRIVVLASSSRSASGHMQACGSRSGEPWFYLRLGTWAGLTLFRVLRGSLRLGKCLGVTVCRAKDSLETAPRTLVPDRGADGRGQRPRTETSWIQALVRLHRQLCWIVAFSCFPES